MIFVILQHLEAEVSLCMHHSAHYQIMKYLLVEMFTNYVMLKCMSYILFIFLVDEKFFSRCRYNIFITV